MLACGWVGRRRQAGRRQEEDWEEGRDGAMEGWKEGEERKGALGGRGIKGWSVGVL
jgi:hypothetical protein